MPEPSVASSLQGLSELIEGQRKLAETARQLARTRSDQVDLATLPKTEVHRIGSKVLYHCEPAGGHAHGVPLLVIYALVGRYTVLDLQADRSFLRNLVDAGLDVYVVDWGHPTRADRFDDLGDYVEGYLDGFVEVIRSRAGEAAINVFGICQGGVLALCHAALFPDKVRNLLLAVTPVDFHADQAEPRPDRGFMNVWARGLEAGDIDLMVEALGNLPGDIGGIAFSMMTPMRSLTKYNLTLVEVGQDEAKLMNFLRMEKWLADRPDHPGAAGRQWLRELYQENRLYEGEFELSGQKVDLGAIDIPVLNIFALDDHIIPPTCSKALARKVGSSDYTEIPLPGGHVGLFVSSRSQGALTSSIAEWLQERDG